MKKLIMTLAAAILVGCGGGGDGGFTVDVAKFVGDYVSCDDNHKRRFVTINEAGHNTLQISFREKFYEFSDCSGDIKGWMVTQDPMIFDYIGASIQNVYGYPIKYKYNMVTADSGTLTTPNTKIEVSGSWARFNSPTEHCIEFNSTNLSCVNPTVKSSKEDIVLILENNLLYTAEPTVSGSGEHYFKVMHIDIRQ